MGDRSPLDPSAATVPQNPPSRGPPVVVKLGGAILTRKRQAERLRPKLLARLAQEVAASRPRALVLLHGAGSFGHPAAQRWGLAGPPAIGSSPRERVRGAAIVQAEVRRLHARLLAALLDAGADPISVPISTHAENRAGVLARFDDAPFRRSLALGGMPVSFGDVVPDSEWGYSILSADTVAVALVRSIGAQRVIFVSDVPGVFLDPHRRGPVRPEITPQVVRELADGEPSADVTGGILGKARAMLEIAGLGVDAALISGLSDGALSRAIRGEAVYGSWAKAASPTG
jgi:isopentenyl phosphate kinase